MNKGILLSILGLFLILAFSLTANATADVTYKYNLNNVTVEVFDCLDASCSTVRPFSGTLLNGNTTNNGELTVSYPTNLATPFGYGVFHFSKGTVPFVALATWNGNGATNVNILLNKIKTCRSVIDTFSVTNDAKPNIPLVINVNASLDATTRSAFKLLNNPVAFIPDSYVQDFFSSDVKVTLEIKDLSNSVVNNQVQEFKAANGNAIRADETVRTEFSWTPPTAGTFTAIVTSEVTDDQCENTDQQLSAKGFDVLSQEPAGECYTLLNDLATTNPHPKVGEVVKATFSKISNHADGAGSLTSLPTNVSYIVSERSTGNVVFSKTETLAANPNSVAKTAHEFEFTALNEGNHVITISGNAESSQCNGLTNRRESVGELLFIGEQRKFNLNFKLVDSATGKPVEKASVRLTGTNVDVLIYSDKNGEALFTGLKPDTYNYEIKHQDFQTVTGKETITDSDRDVTIALQRNKPPQPVHDLTFVVLNEENDKSVSGAFVEFNGKDVEGNDVSRSGYTNLDGELKLDDIRDGDYLYTISHNDFLTATGRVVLTSTSGDVQVNVRLTPGKQPKPEPKKEELSLFVSSIRIPAAFESRAGDRLEVALNFENNGDLKLDNARATVTILELGSRGSVGPFDLKPGDSLTRRVLIDLPEDAELGTYSLRITIGNGQKDRVIYRELDIS